jgi:integrase
MEAVLARLRSCGGIDPMQGPNDPGMGDLVLTWIENEGWHGKGADLRLDAAKCLASWLVERKRAYFPRSQLKGLRKFYKGRGRAEIVWTDEEVELFASRARKELAEGVIFMRGTGSRPGDLVQVAPRHARRRSDGGRTIIIQTSKGRRYERIANVPLDPGPLEILERAEAEGRKTVLLNSEGNPWKSTTLAKEVRLAMDKLKMRDELWFNDLRGTRATELIWSGITAAHLALQMGWNLATAGRMMTVHGSLNPDALGVNRRSAVA